MVHGQVVWVNATRHVNSATTPLAKLLVPAAADFQRHQGPSEGISDNYLPNTIAATRTSPTTTSERTVKTFNDWDYKRRRSDENYCSLVGSVMIESVCEVLSKFYALILEYGSIADRRHLPIIFIDIRTSRKPWPHSYRFHNHALCVEATSRFVIAVSNTAAIVVTA